MSGAAGGGATSPRCFLTTSRCGCSLREALFLVATSRPPASFHFSRCTQMQIFHISTFSVAQTKTPNARFVVPVCRHFIFDVFAYNPELRIANQKKNHAAELQTLPVFLIPFMKSLHPSIAPLLWNTSGTKQVSQVPGCNFSKEAPKCGLRWPPDSQRSREVEPRGIWKGAWPPGWAQSDPKNPTGCFSQGFIFVFMLLVLI